STASAVTPDGSVVVGFADQRAMRWTQATGLVYLSGGVSRGRAVSPDGQAVVGCVGCLFGSSEAFLWRPQTGSVLLGDLPGGLARSDATAISADGSRIVGSGCTDLGAEAFIYDAAHGMRNLRKVLCAVYGLGPVLDGWVL